MFAGLKDKTCYCFCQCSLSLWPSHPWESCTLAVEGTWIALKPARCRTLSIQIVYNLITSNLFLSIDFRRHSVLQFVKQSTSWYTVPVPLKFRDVTRAPSPRNLIVGVLLTAVLERGNQDRWQYKECNVFWHQSLCGRQSSPQEKGFCCLLLVTSCEGWDVRTDNHEASTTQSPQTTAIWFVVARGQDSGKAEGRKHGMRSDWEIHAEGYQHQHSFCIAIIIIIIIIIIINYYYYA